MRGYYKHNLPRKDNHQEVSLYMPTGKNKNKSLKDLQDTIRGFVVHGSKDEFSWIRNSLPEWARDKNLPDTKLKWDVYDVRSTELISADILDWDEVHPDKVKQCNSLQSLSIVLS